jgi:hypothetical protein
VTGGARLPNRLDIPARVAVCAVEVVLLGRYARRAAGLRLINLPSLDLLNDARAAVLNAWNDLETLSTPAC